MSHARARRHYRVAQKEVQQSPAKGIFIPHEQKNRLIIMAIVIVFVVFLKGLIFGHLTSRNND